MVKLDDRRPDGRGRRRDRTSSRPPRRPASPSRISAITRPSRPRAAAGCAWSRSRACPSSSWPARRSSAKGIRSSDRERPGPRGPARTSSSSCWPTIRSTARSATRRGSAGSRIITIVTAFTPSRFDRGQGEAGQEGADRRGLLLDRERCVLCTRCVRFLRRGHRDGRAGGLRAGRHGPRSAIYEGEPGRQQLLRATSSTSARSGPSPTRISGSRRRAWFLTRRPSDLPPLRPRLHHRRRVHPGYPLRPKRRSASTAIRPARTPRVNGYWICDLGRTGCRDIDDGRPAAVVEERRAGPRR